jgi:hypothetical protein
LLRPVKIIFDMLVFWCPIIPIRSNRASFLKFYCSTPGVTCSGEMASTAISCNSGSERWWRYAAGNYKLSVFPPFSWFLPGDEHFLVNPVNRRDFFLDP